MEREVLGDVQSAITSLKTLEQLILDGAEIRDGVGEQIRALCALINDEVERLEEEQSEEPKEREEIVHIGVSDNPAAPAPALMPARQRQRKSSRKKHVPPVNEARMTVTSRRCQRLALERRTHLP